MLKLFLRAVVAVAAVAFGCAAYIYLTLPDVRPLRASNPETTAFMQLRAREARARQKEPRRVQYWVPYARISPHLTRAVLVSEDATFWRHEGIDLRQVKESLETNLARRAIARGASTITQQLAKNLYLSPARTPVRKMREILIARRLEGELTKTRILELYLNVIEWGDGIYGAEAAARTYFGRSAASLGPHEAALLAAAIVSPRVLNPARPTRALLHRQQVILQRMGITGGPARERRADGNGADGAPPAPVPNLPAPAAAAKSGG